MRSCSSGTSIYDKEYGIKARNTWVLFTAALVALSIIAIIISLGIYDFPRYSIIRGAALFGYLAVFLASLSSFFMRELTRFFGRPFIRIHHIIAVTGLVVLVVHALFNAWYSETLGVFIPKFDSLIYFFEHGGRPALWLILIASLIALLRNSIGDYWRLIHRLNYVAFLLATFHALSLGTDFRYVGMKIIATIMAAVLVVVYVLKRTRMIAK